MDTTTNADRPIHGHEIQQHLGAALLPPRARLAVTGLGPSCHGGSLSLDETTCEATQARVTIASLQRGGC